MFTMELHHTELKLALFTMYHNCVKCIENYASRIKGYNLCLEPHMLRSYERIANGNFQIESTT